MTDLTALTPALPASPIMPNPPAEAAENGDLAGIDFAALLGLQLGAAPLVQVRAAQTGGKESPESGKTLPDAEQSSSDAPEGRDAERLDIAVFPPVVAISLPLASVAADPLQSTELPVEKRAAQPPNPTPRDPASGSTLPIHAAPRAAEALAARLDLRFEAQPAKLPEQAARRSAEAGSPPLEMSVETPRANLPGQASARAVEVHAARLAGLRPGPATPEAEEGKSAPANPAVPRPEPAIAPVAHGTSSDASPQGRPGKTPKEQVAVPQVSMPDSAAEPTPVLATTAAPAPAPTTPVAATPALETPRADFAALVDRLAEARDAAGVEPVRLALRHAEFGQVALQIRPDDSGLSVTMASPDPDFARAVSVAVPAASAAQGGESLPQSDNGQSRSSGGTFTGSDPGSPNRGSTTPERRASEDRHRPAPARPGRDPSGDTRSGIFA